VKIRKHNAIARSSGTNATNNEAKASNNNMKKRNNNVKVRNNTKARNCTNKKLKKAGVQT
jgi:hypothetical protein